MKKKQSLQPLINDNNSLYYDRIKPDSATQVHGDVYIGDEHSKFMTSPKHAQSSISFAMDT